MNPINWDDDDEEDDAPFFEGVRTPLPTQDDVTEAWSDFFLKYEHDPVAFAEEVLDLGPFSTVDEELMPHQYAVLAKIRDGYANDKPERRVALRSGHRVGKTRLLAIIALWFIVTRYPQKTLITAPTAGQLFGALYPELRALGRRLPSYIYELFDWMSEEIRLKADPDSSFLQARTASPENASSFQGMHSKNVLMIWDEAAGIDQRLYNAARGSMGSSNAITILAGNPTNLNNYFHDAFTKNAGIWTRFRISSKGLKTVDTDFVTEIVHTFGEDSNEYRIRVLGEFPDTEDESFISASAVRNAMERQIDIPPMSAVVYGVDPARFGDDRTVITKRRGSFNVAEQIAINKASTMDVVGRIVNEAAADRDRLVREFKDAGRPLLFLPPVPAQIVVDVIGIGAGIVDRLRELGYPVIACNVSEKATTEPNCVRERDAVWKRGKLWIESGKGAIKKDTELAAELSAPHYSYTSTGDLQLEPKKEMKKRIGRSPDKADSMLLTLIVDPTIFTEFLKTGDSAVLGYGTGPRGALKRRR